MEPDTLNLKIAMLGDSFVGKTTLRRNFFGLPYEHTYEQTLGVDLASMEKILENGDKVNVVVWDMAGAPQFKRIRKMFYRGIHGCMIAYDSTSPFELDGTLSHWLKEVLEFTMGKTIPTAIIANKIDLPNLINETKKDVILEEVKSSGYNEYPLNLFQTSAKTGEGVEEAFDWIMYECLKLVKK